MIKKLLTIYYEIYPQWAILAFENDQKLEKTIRQW